MTDPPPAAAPPPDRPPVPVTPTAAPLVLLGADDGLVCVDDLCVTLPDGPTAADPGAEPAR